MRARTWQAPSKRRSAVVAAGMAAALLTSSLGVARAPSRAGGGPLVTVIVRAADGAAAAAERAVGALGGHVLRELHIIKGFSAAVPAFELAPLSRADGVISVTPDRPLHMLTAINGYNQVQDTGSIYNTTLMTGAQSMWQAGYTGKGVDIAMIDSGVVPVNGLTVPGKVIYGPDLSWDSQNPDLVNLDAFGHGTHMAGIMVGRDDAAVPGTYAGDSGDFVGMAPDSRIVSVKVADSNGNTDVTQVLAAIDWVVEHAHDPGLNIRVLNLSFGSDSMQSYLLDPLSYAVETAWHDGIVVVAAAGNQGWKTSGVDDPADNPYLVAVGAADTHGTNTLSDDTVAAFSSVGDGYRNPDLVAPGIHMASLRDVGSYIDVTYPSGVINSRFFRGSGTSQATAVVSGAAALLLQQRPLATPDAIKALLTGTATPLAGQTAAQQGSGELNLRNALYAFTPIALQAWAPSTGTGSIEGARGSTHITMNGVTLQGEVDIFGNPVNTSALATALSQGTAWVGGVFNGAVWSGGGWADATTWQNNTWSDNSWSNNTWSSSTWSNNTWSNNTWSNNTWSNNTWSNNTWSNNTWSSAAWN